MTAQGSIEFYDRFAAKLAPTYDGVSFEAVHGPMLHHLPPSPADVLDVGAGSGRDAAGMLALGHRVTAVEPARRLRQLGESRVDGVRWISDRLPELAALRLEGGRFDFILCSAVLMSIASDQLDSTFESFATLLRDPGKLLISVRLPSAEDEPGLLHEHSAAALHAAASRAGLVLADVANLKDALGRHHRWSAFVYNRA